MSVPWPSPKPPEQPRAGRAVSDEAAVTAGVETALAADRRYWGRQLLARLGDLPVTAISQRELTATLAEEFYTAADEIDHAVGREASDAYRSGLSCHRDVVTAPSPQMAVGMAELELRRGVGPVTGQWAALADLRPVAAVGRCTRCGGITWQHQAHDICGQCGGSTLHEVPEIQSSRRSAS